MEIAFYDNAFKRSFFEHKYKQLNKITKNSLIFLFIIRIFCFPYIKFLKIA